VCVGLIECKLRSLRTEFAARLRGQKKPSGAEGGKPKKPWRFFDSLLFLKDCIQPRGNTSNLSLSSSSDNREVNVNYAVIVFLLLYLHTYAGRSGLTAARLPAACRVDSSTLGRGRFMLPRRPL